MSDWLESGVSDDAALERVRQRVRTRIRRGRLRKPAALLAVALLSFWPREPQLETLALDLPASPRAPAIERIVLPPPAPRIERAKYKAAEKITLFTDDPNVVIILVNESGGSL